MPRGELISAPRPHDTSLTRQRRRTVILRWRVRLVSQTGYAASKNVLGRRSIAVHDLEQSQDRAAMLHQSPRPVERVAVFRVGADAQRMVHGGDQIIRVDRPILRVSAVPIGSAIHLAAADAAAGHQAGVARRPMVAPAGTDVVCRRRPQLRRAAELADQPNQGAVQQTARARSASRAAAARSNTGQR